MERLFNARFERQSPNRSTDAFDQDLKGLEVLRKIYILIIFVEDAHHSFLHLFELFSGNAPNDLAADVRGAAMGQLFADGLESRFFCHASRPLFSLLFYKKQATLFKGYFSRDPQTPAVLLAASSARRALPRGEGISRPSFAAVSSQSFMATRTSFRASSSVSPGAEEPGKLGNDRYAAIVIGAIEDLYRVFMHPNLPRSGRISLISGDLILRWVRTGP